MEKTKNRVMGTTINQRDRKVYWLHAESSIGAPIRSSCNWVGAPCWESIMLRMLFILYLPRHRFATMSSL